MSVTFGKKEILVEAPEVLAFVATGTLVIFWNVLNTHTNKQTNKQSVCIFISVVPSVLSIFVLLLKNPVLNELDFSGA